MRERVHAQMIVVQTNVHRESTTAQVEGSAKILVTVVATQELKAGDVLRRFKAEVAPDETRRGNNNDRYNVYPYILYMCIYTLSLYRDCLATHGTYSLC